MNQSMSATRLESVDALRGIAATGVVAIHAFGMFDLAPTQAVGAGYLVMGVPMFFVVSAFSMSLAYDGGLSDGASLKRYALRRFFRIAPLFYLMLAVWLAYYWYLGSPSRSFGHLLSNITFAFGILQDGIVPAGWSIGVEMCFYLVFPLLLVWRGIGAAAVFLVLACLGAWSVNSTTGEVDSYHYWTHVMTNAPYFCAGLLGWRLYRVLHNRRIERLAHSMLAASCAIIISMIIWGPAIDGPQTAILPVPLTLILGWGSGFMLLVLSQALSPVGLFDNRVTRYLGKISYSLYLSHPFVIFATNLPLVVTGWIGGPIALILILGATLALSIPIAMLLYHLIERPFMTLGRRLSA